MIREEDDEDRRRCPRAGEVGHWGCGVCRHGKLVARCESCLQRRVEGKPMGSASDIAEGKTDEELDRHWATAAGHPEKCACTRCVRVFQSLRSARAAGIECTCRDPDGSFCDLHGITLNNG